MGRIVLLGGLGIAAGFLLLALVLATLPKDFFARPRRASGIKKILKNVAGGAALVAGTALSLPLVPGPGFVLILVGLALLDFPGRQRLLRKLVRRPGVHAKLNGFRRRLGRPQFILPESAGRRAA